MSENESEIDSRSQRPVKPSVSDRHEPIHLNSKAQGFSYSNVASGKRIDSKKRLFVEDRIYFRQPVVAIALKHIACCLHTSTNRCSDLRIKAARFPVAICEKTGPEQFVMTSFNQIPLQTEC